MIEIDWDYELILAHARRDLIRFEHSTHVCIGLQERLHIIIFYSTKKMLIYKEESKISFANFKEWLQSLEYHGKDIVLTNTHTGIYSHMVIWEVY